jgi:membrane-associated protease RseP (regulator of RpoE activity)
MFSLGNACLAEERDGVKSDRSNDTVSDDDGAVHHAALGVSLNESDGRVTVLAVMPGSPAAKAGLRVGDQIRSVGDERIRTAKGLAEEIAENRPGTQVELSIRRSGEKQTLKATLGAQDSAFGLWDRQANRERTAHSYSPNDRQADAAQQQVRQHIRAIQHQVSELQQEINNLQSTLAEPQSQGAETRIRAGNQMQNNGQQRYYDGQQGYYGGRQGRMLDRTGENYSTARGWSRDHGPRETDSGNNANEN